MLNEKFFCFLCFLFYVLSLILICCFVIGWFRGYLGGCFFGDIFYCILGYFWYCCLIVIGVVYGFRDWLDYDFSGK